MIRRVIKKAGAILVAAGLCITMSCPQVSAAIKTNQVSKAARYVQPEEWNRQEIKAYQFDSQDDFSKYILTGGLHLYNNDYKGKDRWVKVKVTDPGIFIISATSEDENGKIALYDATKTKLLSKDITDNEDEDDLTAGYVTKVQAGDEFYVKLPQKISKIFLLPGVIKDGFDEMEDRDYYLESANGTTSYHTFTIEKRSETDIDIATQYKNIGSGTVVLEKYVKGKWIKIGYTANIKAGVKEELVYGLRPAKYRIGIKMPKGQIVSVGYSEYDRSKKVTYRRSRAKWIDYSTDNVYTQGEKAARWYKVSVTTTKYKNKVWVAKASVGGGFKFSIYKKGKKKAIKTVKVTKNNKYKRITLPKQKGTYYVKVSKLTSKTNGSYEIENYAY